MENNMNSSTDKPRPVNSSTEKVIQMYFPTDKFEVIDDDED